MSQTILVLGASRLDRKNLSRPPFTADHFIFDATTVENNGDPEILLQQLLENYGTRAIDGILGTSDFASLMAAILAQEFNLPAPPLTPLFHCQHKYYARQIQQRHIPEATPNFALVTPQTVENNPLEYPFFIKPVRATRSILAQTIPNLEALIDFLNNSQAQLKTLTPGFNQLLRRYSPLAYDADYFIAEEILTGTQVTVDGFVCQGEVTIMGIVDSIMYPGTIAFQRFEYPSRLPITVQTRMADLSRRVVQGLELNNCMFNLEFFYNPDPDTLHIIEVNPRMSFLFADLYQKVDGTNSYEIQRALSTGVTPHFEPRQGTFATAMSVIERQFHDYRVLRTPSATDIEAFQHGFPDAILCIFAQTGTRLSTTAPGEKNFRYATLNLGGQSWSDLYDRYAMIKELLTFEFADESYF